MRFALWTVAIVATAVGLALALREAEGYVIIVSPPWRAELSLALLVAAILAGYVGFFALARLTSYLAGIPARVRAHRAERARAKARAALNAALLAFFQGRYASAERAAADAMADEESRGVAAIVAARSAHELGRFAERETFLGQATGAAAVDEARLTTLADLLLSQGRHEEALDEAGKLIAADAANVHALRLRVAALTGLGRWKDMIAALDGLVRQGGLSPAEAEPSLREAYRRHLEALAGDAAALEAEWESVPAVLRADPSITATAARGLRDAGKPEAAGAVIAAALERQWDAGLVALYAECAGENALPLIERAEAWLPAHARDPVLLLTLGKLCARQSLWGKAQSYLEASLAMQPSQEGHMALAALMEKLGKPAEAGRHFRKSAELAG